MEHQERMQMEPQSQQFDNREVQNELLPQRSGQEQDPRQAPRQNRQGDSSVDAVMRNWRADNPWFDVDKPRIAFAVLYAKQLRQEQPNLLGRPFLDAISSRILEVFGP